MPFEDSRTPRLHNERAIREVREQVMAYLTLPEKRGIGNRDEDLAKKLGLFLVDHGYIRGVGMWRGSWGCKYEHRIIYLNELPMPDDQYKYYIFRLGRNSETGQKLLPTPGEEADQYRFLHEVSHAYQEYLMDKESPNDPLRWYDKVLSRRVDSNFGLLFEYCYRKRQENSARGLSTWGNVPDYNDVEHLPSQIAVMAIEDANELVTMYLWHPEYLDTFLEYLSGRIPGYNNLNLEEDGLVRITEEEALLLRALIEEYIAEMKRFTTLNV